MRHRIQNFSALSLVVFLICSVSIMSCDEQELGDMESAGQSKTYALIPVSDSDLSGTVKFTKQPNGTTVVAVDLNGASPIGSYRAFICENDVATDGKVVISLTSVAGGSGSSITTVTQFNDGTAISFNQLLNFDGHLKIVSNESTPKCMAQSNIGVN